MSIVMIGAPGSGKTTVGAGLAKALNLEFVDVDQRIEEVLGKSIAAIFADEGEAYFRQAEESATLELLDSAGVISLGGGAVMNPRIQAALSDHDVIWLRTSVGTASRRVGMNTARPLLLGNVRGRLIELLRERTPVYESVATTVIDTDGRSVNSLVRELAEARQ